MAGSKADSTKITDFQLAVSLNMDLLIANARVVSYCVHLEYIIESD